MYCSSISASDFNPKPQVTCKGLMRGVEYTAEAQILAGEQIVTSDDVDFETICEFIHSIGI